MKEDALKKISQELAAEIVAAFASEEVKALLESTKAASDIETGTFDVVITTENLDRYNEVIKLDGWELEHYRKNPIVLWGHDHNQPIGMATSVEIIDGKMVARGKFAPTEKAQEVRKLYDFGIIKATSVGFIEKEREGNLITKAELLEFSFVSVPANPYALSLAMEKGLGINDLVTKGIMFVETEVATCKGIGICEDGECDHKDPTDATPPEDGEAPGGEPAAAEPEGEDEGEKTFGPLIAKLREVVVALEDAGETTGDPERDAAPDEPTEDEKAYAAFTEKRKLIQELATTVGDVLAEARQVIEGRK